MTIVRFPRTARSLVLTFAIGFSAVSCFGKEQGVGVFTWPESGKSLLRFTFGRFHEVSSIAGQRTYVTDTTAANLSDLRITDASFYLYFYDKGKTRIGEGNVQISNVEPGQTVKFQTTVTASGAPATMSLEPRFLPPDLEKLMPSRTVQVSVASSPSGARLKVDGNDMGTTPANLRLAVGKHNLEFAKEGFDPGSFPIQIGPGDLSDTYSYEFGNQESDIIELWDGSTLTGDLQSLNTSEVVMELKGGETRRFDRLTVKRISFARRSRQ